MRERLKKIFISLNKKSAEISRETKIDQATISYMLSGKRTITERTIQLIPQRSRILIKTKLLFNIFSTSPIHFLTKTDAFF